MKIVKSAQCKLCNSLENRTIIVKKGYALHRCFHCGFEFLNQEFSNAELQDFYSEGYFNDSEGEGFGDYIFEKKAMEYTAQYRLKSIQTLAPDAKNLIDVGCGMGFFLNVAKNYYSVSGVEISQYASSYARNELGLNVLSGTLERSCFPTSHFNIVTLWDVLEHVADPMSFVKEIRRILKPMGLLVFSTPNVGSLMCKLQRQSWRLYDFPYHLSCFSVRTVKYLLKECNFELIKINNLKEWHSLQYLSHGLNAYYPNGISYLMKKYFQNSKFGEYLLPLSLGDIMTVNARKG